MKNILLLFLIALSCVIFSCGNDSANAEDKNCDCSQYISKITKLQTENDSLDKANNALVESLQRFRTNGNPDFVYPTKSTKEPLEKFKYVGQVYRGERGGLFQVYLDKNGKRWKHYISSEKERNAILATNNFIDVSRGTSLEELNLSERIPIN